MRAAGLAGGLGLVLAANAHAKPPQAARPPVRPPPPVHVEVHPAPPLPMLPSVARVRVEAARDRVVVVEDVNLPRGDWRSGGLDLYVAFGAPGAPNAIDARLASLPQEPADSRPEDSGELMAIEQAVRRTPNAQLLLGRPQMAGAVIHIKEGDLRRAYAVGEVAVLRIRSLLSPPAPDPSGARDVVVRLGIVGDVALTLGRVQVISLEGFNWIRRAEANLCGPEAEGLPLSVAILPKGDSSDAGASPEAKSGVGPIVPALAVRHPSDDLCIRWWAAP